MRRRLTCQRATCSMASWLLFCSGPERHRQESRIEVNNDERVGNGVSSSPYKRGTTNADKGIAHVSFDDEASCRGAATEELQLVIRQARNLIVEMPRIVEEAKLFGEAHDE